MQRIAMRLKLNKTAEDIAHTDTWLDDVPLRVRLNIRLGVKFMRASGENMTSSTEPEVHTVLLRRPPVYRATAAMGKTIYNNNGLFRVAAYYKLD